MSAKNLFNTLIKRNIVGDSGVVYFQMNGIKTIINDNNIIGNVIQSWLQSFMDKNNIFYRLVEHTQKFPDFYLNKKLNNISLLEVKCFTGSANFDVANFLAYCHSIVENPYRLNADYLIFEYEPQLDKIVIKNIWLKKVWEICGSSERSSIKIQWKKGQPYNIRPANWKGGKNVKYPPFTSRLEFVQALYQVLKTHPSADELRKNWLKNVSTLFKKQTGSAL